MNVHVQTPNRYTNDVTCFKHHLQKCTLKKRSSRHQPEHLELRNKILIEWLESKKAAVVHSLFVRPDLLNFKNTLITVCPRSVFMYVKTISYVKIIISEGCLNDPTRPFRDLKLTLQTANTTECHIHMRLCCNVAHKPFSFSWFRQMSSRLID